MRQTRATSPNLSPEEIEMHMFLKEVFPRATIRQLVNLRIEEMKIYRLSKNKKITNMSQYIAILKLRKRQFEKRQKKKRLIKEMKKEQKKLNKKTRKGGKNFKK